MHRIFTVFVLAILLPTSPGFAAAQTEPGKLSGQFSPSIIVLISALCTPVILIGFAVIFVIWWQRSQATVSGPSLNVLQPRQKARGMDARAVEALPTFVYADVKSLKVGKGALECAICLSEFEDRETLRLLPKCDHVFHTQCIDAWLGNHVTCPVCRSDLTDEPAVEGITGTESIDIESQTGEGRREPDQESRDRVTATVEPVTPAKLLRWNTTGHLWVQPGERKNTDRFTLRLPEEIRKQILGVGEGKSSKGRRLNRRQSMSERWLAFKTSSFQWRNGSPKGAAVAEGTSYVRPEQAVRPPV
ncbi:PREDICTED: E3 ubiquitin-protein ligase ATL31-like [Tarenaya hassleriana]|uniref:E3 ubiquitin-protein ligase ATL31-like n=1 Tax=Tarenaya hassleriana TaxID=28532 RepID=UPI00053C3A5D|nr:PREDICTED: E3 ubiquitin-protein ligase ATL31-like [Tarenaya hassleriana]